MTFETWKEWQNRTAIILILSSTLVYFHSFIFVLLGEESYIEVAMVQLLHKR